MQKRAITRIVTPNFDRLIEVASDESLHIVCTEAECVHRPSAALYKIHGSIDQPSSIIAMLNQVSRGLGPNRRQLLLETLQRTCLVVGWSDNDIDLTPPFLESPEGLLVWFNYVGDREKIGSVLLIRADNIGHSHIM